MLLRFDAQALGTKSILGKVNKEMGDPNHSNSHKTYPHCGHLEALADIMIARLIVGCNQQWRERQKGSTSSQY